MVKKILILILCLIVGVSAVNAAAGLNVVLANQNPDPVSPGNYVYLNVKVANSDSTEIRDLSISLLENANFQIAQGEDNSKNLGNIPAYSTLEGTTATIAKFKVLVDEDTPLGLNTIKFKVKDTYKEYVYEFDILVQDSSPVIHIESLETKQTNPGESSQLKINLENINSINLNNLKVALDLANVDDKVTTMTQGSNEKVVQSLKADNSVEMIFDISVSPEAESKSYLVPIIISYEDTLENTFSNTIYGSIKVYSEPDISLELDSQDVFTVGRGKFSLAIANPGTSKIKGVQLKILPSDDYQIIEGENQYIGDLNPDDFQTLQGDIYISNSDSAVLNVELSYADSYDKKTVETIKIPLKIYNQDELKEYGFMKGGSSSFGTIVFVLIVLLVVVFFWRRHNKKKHLRQSRSN